MRIAIGFLLAFSACVLSAEGVAAMPQTQGNTLQNISVFHAYGEYRNAGENADMNCSAYGVETDNGRLPLDATVTNGDKKVYRLSGDGGVMFPINYWSGFTLAPYNANGHIVFDIKGAVGGEDFNIGFRSLTRGVEATNTVKLSDYAAVTTSWQSARIPIKDITADTSKGFSIGNIFIIVIELPAELTCYLSEMYLVSPDDETQYPLIKVNQLGYEIGHGKYALVSCFPDTVPLTESTAFDVVGVDGAVKYTGRLQPVAAKADTTSGEVVFAADFSALDEAGDYYIRISDPPVADSFGFAIGADMYAGLLTDLTRYFYFQRQGLDLTAAHAGAFARDNLHPGDTAVKKFSQRGEDDAPTYDVSQGWYDAGDFGKYFPPAAATVTDLLFAYEFFPAQFDARDLNIPESDNAAPDILDEIKWELDMMLKFEDGATGGFYEVANYQNDTIYLIDTDGADQSPDTKSTVATAWAAGVFAHAYAVYKDVPLYASYAETLLAAAERAWAYLDAHPENRWVYGANRSYQQEDATLAQVRFLAAAALYRATAQPVYNDYVRTRYESFNYGREFNPSQVVSIGELGTGFILYALSDAPDDAVLQFFGEKLTRFETGQTAQYKDKAWPTALVDWGYFWGSSKPIARIPVELYLGNRVLGRDTAPAVAMLRDAAHYILGINPLSFSFISGYGASSVSDIYSGIYSADGIDAIPPGYMAGGANQYESGFLSKYPAKAYVDSDREWTTNEHAIYWNAAAVLSLAATVDTADVTAPPRFTPVAALETPASAPVAAAPVAEPVSANAAEPVAAVAPAPAPTASADDTPSRFPVPGFVVVLTLAVGAVVAVRLLQRK